MKVGMFLVRENGRKETMACLFICSGCGEPIHDISEANFAPRKDQWDDPVTIKRGLELLTDKVEIWHWACDAAGAPWKNASDSLGHYFQNSSISIKGH